MPPKTPSNKQSTSRAKPTPSRDICQDCFGTGYVILEQGAAPCECQKTTRSSLVYDRANIPRKFFTKSLSNFTARSAQHKEIIQGAKGFLKTFRAVGPDQNGKGLILMGKEGTGKTHVALAILKEVIDMNFKGLYWNVPQLFLELRRRMDESALETESELFDHADSVDLLVLDDLGAERSSEYVTDRLYVLINSRYEDDKATIITTNRSLSELRQQLGPRIVSRICEMCVQVEFPQGDYRMLNIK